jgi:hypothetical protein
VPKIALGSPRWEERTSEKTVVLVLEIQESLDVELGVLVLLLVGDELLAGLSHEVADLLPHERQTVAHAREQIIHAREVFQLVVLEHRNTTRALHLQVMTQSITAKPASAITLTVLVHL